MIEARQRFIDTRRIAKREQGRIRAHQNSLRYNAQNVNEAEIAQIEAKLQDLETAYGAETDDSALIAEWVQHRDRLQKQVDTLTHQQNEALSGFNDVAHLRQIIGTIETAIQENTGLETKREELIQQTGRLESEIEALTTVCKTLRTLLESGEQHCPTCYQEVEREVIQRIVDEKEEEKSQRSRELKTHNQSLEAETKNLESRRELEQRLQTLQARLTQYKQRTQDLDKIQTELNALSSRLSGRGIQQREHNPSGTLTTLDKQQLKAEIDSQRKRLDKLKQEEAVRLDRLGALQRANTDAAKVEKTLLSLELACSGIDKTIETLQQQILKPAEDELHHWIGKMQLFGETRVDLQREHLLPSLSIDGADRSLMLLSGSEKMFLYLCFKVALARVLGNPGFFVLDDPTLHLDGERKNLMVDFIRQLAEEYQVVVTSYDEDVRTGLEGAHLIEMTRET